MNEEVNEKVIETKDEKKLQNNYLWGGIILSFILVLVLGFIIIWNFRSTSSPQTTTENNPAYQIQATLARPPATATPQIFQVDNLQSYTHSSGQFSIDYSTSWQIIEQDIGAIFINTTVQGAYSVFFSYSDTKLPTSALADFLVDFVNYNFAQESEFEILSNQSNTVQFKSVNPYLGTAISEASIFQKEQAVYITLITAHETEWMHVADQLRKLSGSLQTYKLQSPVATPTPLPPMWALYAYSAQDIVFMYPTNWVITETAQRVETVWPEHQFAFAVDVISMATVISNTQATSIDDIQSTLTVVSNTQVVSTVNAISITELTEDLSSIETFTWLKVGELAEQFEQFQMFPVTPYQAGETIGYTTDYLYVDEKNNAIAGSIIMVGIDDMVYHITIIAPALTYETALEWFNPMLQSFQVLKEDEEKYFLTPTPTN